MREREDFNEHVKYWQDRFEELKDAYRDLFCELYEFDKTDSYWTGNVLFVSDYFFGLYDMMYSVNNQVHEDLFFRWYDYSLMLSKYSLGNSTLENFIKGYRPYSEYSIDKLRELESKYDKSKAEFDDYLSELRHTK